MTPNIIDLDHVMIGVESHAAAIAAFERLGFQVRAVRPLTPMGGGPAGGIGGSAAIVMRPAGEGIANYLELSFYDEAHGSPAMRPILSGVRGGAMLVHMTRDAAALHAEWQARGLALHPLIEVRLVAMGGAGAGQRIRVILPDGPQPVFCNACEYQSIAEFRDQRLMNHPNGAVRWTGAIVTAEPYDMPEVRDHLARVYEMTAQGEGDHVRFDLPTMTVDIMVPALFRHHYPALHVSAGRPRIQAVQVAVSDLGLLRKCLRASNIAHGRSAAGGITVDGRNGTGIDLIFG